ncbi:MAG: dipicolinate synthase subunit B [Bacillus thermozeamaize]|uniref:Dipicolinate synthase subunit B n=1 Tax=Bacillus thermozeamaize TaxID=230954 RepID=A0A1Y3PLW6_9BACI|nr:MAG: dipicolinate synthase subunit B [Bacillus thermozeamaize]
MELTGKTVGIGLSASHCTYNEVFPQIERLVQEGVSVVPIVSYSMQTTDTKFGRAEDWLNRLRQITGNELITNVVEAEPLGPGKTLDVMVIAPCTGNTLSKLANAITDSPVLMAAKATLRNRRPVVVAISTNDALGLNAHNLAKLLTAKHIYFVPFGQDSPEQKPTSLVARMDLIKATCEAALDGRQLQPMLIERFRDT